MTTIASLDFLILAHPRSGSSLLRRLLNEIDEILVPPESSFATWIRNRRLADDGVSVESPLTADDYARLALEVAAARKFEFWGLAADQLAAWFKLRRPRTLRAALVEVYRCYADGLGCPGALLGDKNNWHFFVPSAAIETLSPKRVVLLFRDPVRVWASYLRLRDQTAGISELPAYFPDVSVRLNEFCRAWAEGHTDVLRACSVADLPCDIVEYGSVTAAPGLCVATLLERQGRSQRTGGFARRAGSVQARLAEPEAFAPWKGAVPGPVDAATQPSMNRVVPPDDVTRIAAMCGDVLAQLRLAAGVLADCQ